MPGTAVKHLLRRGRLATLLSALPVFIAVAAVAETPVSNYVYANYLGSGYYTVADQQVGIVNIPFSATREGSKPYASRWRLPVSIGSYSLKFDPENIDSTRLPQAVDTLTFIPGIEWIIPYDEHLHFEPYVDLGVGTNFSTREDVLIYSTGLSAFYKFGKGGRHEWVNRILYAGYRSFSTKQSNGYASLQSGVDWRLPGGFRIGNHDYYGTFYTMAFWHFDKVKLVSKGPDTVTLTNNFEVGLTLRTAQPFDLRWFNVDRIGLGYRFGDGLKAWRLIFSSPL